MNSSIMDCTNVDRLSKICRVCMLEHYLLFHIFEDTKPTDAEVSLVQIFNECTSYKVKLNDALPQQICVTCKEAALAAFRFKQQTEEAYRILTGIQKDVNFFKNPDNRVDIATQTDEMPMHACELCAEKFLDGYALRQHRREVHRDDTNRCKVCNSEFDTLRQLKAHLMRLHPEHIDKSANAKCYICQKQFSRKDHLRRHLRNIHKQYEDIEMMEPLIKIEEGDVVKNDLDNEETVNNTFNSILGDTSEGAGSSDDEK